MVNSQRLNTVMNMMRKRNQTMVTDLLAMQKRGSDPTSARQVSTAPDAIRPGATDAISEVSPVDRAEH